MSRPEDAVVPSAADIGLAPPDFTRAFPTGRLGWCRGCQKNKHRDCDLHMNDGAGDAEDFIDVNCSCPCGGEVYGDLIDLVAGLRRGQEHEECARLLAHHEQRGDRLWSALDQVRTALDRMASEHDDEGNWMVEATELEQLSAALAPVWDEERP